MDNVTPAAPQPSQEAPKQEAPKAETVHAEPVAAHDNDTVMTVLSYLGILVLIPLLVVKAKSEKLKFHVRQGIALAILEIALSILPYPLDKLGVVPTVLSIVCIVKALQGAQWEIPFLGEYAKKIKI